MHLLIVNCNTSVDVTRVIDESAKSVASIGTQIVTVQPAWGPSSAEGFMESFVTAAAVLEVVAMYDGDIDAIVMAGYGEHGREGMRQLAEVPVVDVTESSAYFASLLSHRFGVLTTMATTIPGIRSSLQEAGMLDRCAEVAALELPVLKLLEDSPATVEALARKGRELISRGSDSIVLGCAGFAGLDEKLEALLGVPVIDGVTSAVVLAESLVRLGKRTSKVGPYVPVDPTKKWSRWPVSGSNAVRATISGFVYAPGQNALPPRA